MAITSFKRKLGLWVKGCTLLTLVFVSNICLGQDDCNCISGEKITVCYFSTTKFCPPAPECRYTLDGLFMVNSLNKKLQNPNLFGPLGKSKCPIVLEKLEDVDSIEYLEQKECNIVFLGAFSDFFGGEFLPSNIPPSDLETIKAWSTKCPTNLTITSQSEAEAWDYKFADLNINPNKPDPDFTDYSIFNGSFGKTFSFQQGGSFQGIFTSFPSTGYSVLARDKNGEPTIVLDSLTNDIILGDIGILCSNGAGSLSLGAGIQNDNDILACNLFDLGCKIATNSTTMFIEICEGESHSSSGGQILTEEGIYVDSFINNEGCDSLIFTLLEVNKLYYTLYNPKICDNENHSILIGNNIYSKTNTSGTEFLLSSEGCDSTIHIELQYLKSDSTFLEESICTGDTFFVNDIPFTETTYEVVTLQNKNQCDSLIYLDLIFHENYVIQKKIGLCKNEIYVASDGTIITEDSIYSEFLYSQNNCDSVNILYITYHDNYEREKLYSGCRGDGYSIKIGDNIYDEFNPIGTENLVSQYGCDSIINISFFFQPLDTTYLVDTLCPYESYEVGGLEYTGDTDESIILSSSKNCDSLILLTLETFDSDEVALLDFYEIDLNSGYHWNLPYNENSTYEWTADGGISCNNCLEPELSLADLPSFLQLIYTDQYNCTYSSRTRLTYTCTPFFSNIINVNSSTDKNRYFHVEALCPLYNYQMNIYDRWGSNVFSSSRQDEKWDGRFNGKYSEQGVYIYRMTYLVNGVQKQFTGSLTLIH